MSRGSDENIVILSGEVIHVTPLRKTGGGTPVCNVTIRGRRYRRRAGRWVTFTGEFRFARFGPQAEDLANATTGTQLRAEGHLESAPQPVYYKGRPVVKPDKSEEALEVKMLSIVADKVEGLELDSEEEDQKAGELADSPTPAETPQADDAEPQDQEPGQPEAPTGDDDAQPGSGDSSDGEESDDSDVEATPNARKRATELDIDLRTIPIEYRTGQKVDGVPKVNQRDVEKVAQLREEQSSGEEA